MEEQKKLKPLASFKSLVQEHFGFLVSYTDDDDSITDDHMHIATSLWCVINRSEKNA